jgi:hypothetical protein
MPLNEKAANLKTFATVISDGSIRVRVDENTPGAVKREFETPKGEKGEKWEKVYQSLSGLINSLEIKDTDYGQVINLEVDGIVLSLNSDGSYAQDLMKKLPNVNLDEPLEITPYSFTGDSGRPMRGITIMQGGNKIKSHFWDDENQTSINGIPTVSKEESQGYKKDDWKVFFIGVKKFLVNYTLKNVKPNIKTKDDQFLDSLEKSGLAVPPAPEEIQPPISEPDDEIKIENIPF